MAGIWTPGPGPTGGNDTFVGDGTNDTANGVDGNDTLSGGDGADNLSGGLGDDNLSGGAGNDILSAGGGDDVLNGGDGADNLQGYLNSGYAGDVQAYGGAGSDTIDGAFFSIVDGGSGDDTVTIGRSLHHQVTSIDGGADFDTLTIVSSFGSYVSGGTEIDLTKVVNFERIFVHPQTTYVLTNVNVGSSGALAVSISNDYLNYPSSYLMLNGSAVTVGNLTLTGGGGADTLEGGGGNDIIQGNNGDDTLQGGAGNDTASYVGASFGVVVSLALQGGGQNTNAGIDTLAGFENLLGSSNNDTLTGDSSANVLNGGNGNDVLTAGGGVDTASYEGATAGVTVSLTLQGSAQNTIGAGVDTLGDFENLLGSAFGDTLTGNSGANMLVGGDGADALSGGAGQDTLDGGGGDDMIDGGSGADTMIGGAGNDIYIVDDVGDVVTEGSLSGADTIRTNLSSFNAVANVENIIYTGAGVFTVVGGSTAIILTGGAGSDTLIGSLAGGSLNGGDGADVLWFYGATMLSGGSGFDYAIQLDALGQIRSIGSAGIEVYVANNGNDTIDAAGATVTTIIYGGAGSDAITQSNAGGYAFGQDGNDTLMGGEGQDIFLGGAGFDNIMGNGGNDVLYVDGADGTAFDGGTGVDYAIVDTAAAVNVDLTTRNVEVFIGNLGNDLINAAGTSVAMGLYGFGGNDVLTGGGGASQLFGQDGNDILNAGSSNDVLLGGNGSDQVFGNAGDDLLIGEIGNDIIVGGTGADVMWGGAGDDTFRIAASDMGTAQDLIADFGDTIGDNDVINFTGITAAQISIISSNGGALLSIAGGYSLFVIGATAVSIQDDLIFA